MGIKALITDFNIKWDSDYKNILYFATLEQRDEFINTLFISGDYKNDLLEQPYIKIIKKSFNNFSIIFNSAQLTDSIYSKNYIIIYDDFYNEIEFYFIESVKSDGNFEKTILNLKKDIFTTHINFMQNIKNFKLNKGHSKTTNYLGTSFDISNKKLVDFENIESFAKNEVYAELNKTNWLYVFEKTTNANIGENIRKLNEKGEWFEPFKVFVAPMTPINITGNTVAEVPIYINAIENFKKTGGTYNGDNNGAPTDSQTLNVGLTSEITNDIKINYTFKMHTESIQGNGNDWTEIITRSLYIRKANLPQADNTSTYIFLNGSSQFTQQELDNFNNEINNSHSETNTVYINIHSDRVNEKNNRHKQEFILLKIVRHSSTNYDFMLPTFSEFLEKFPNVQGKFGCDATGINQNFSVHGNTPEWFIPDDHPHHHFADSYPVGQESLLYGAVWPQMRENYGQDNTFKGYNEIWINDIYSATSSVWSAVNLINHISKESGDNPLLITAKISNFNPIITNQTTGNLVIKPELDTYIINIQQDLNDLELYFIDNINYDLAFENNKYKKFIPYNNTIDALDGLNHFTMQLENQKEFNIPYELIDLIDNTFNFYHYASITPEWEERIKFISPNFISTTNENNAWNNDKEFIISSNKWEQYKLSSPISSKINPLKDVGKTLSGGAKGLAVGGVKGLVGGLTAGFLKSINNVIHRQDIKRVPNDFNGSGDILGDLIFNNNGLNFTLNKYQFLGIERDFIYENLRRDGLNYDSGLYVEKFDDIKRPNFNFIQIDDLNAYEIVERFNNETINLFVSAFKKGVRIWYDPLFYYDFNEENGDN